MRMGSTETLAGAVVLSAAVLFLGVAWQSGVLRSDPGYEVTARFNDIDGLEVGADVRLSGVRIGAVTGRMLDQSDYRAVVSITLRDGIRLPEDSQVAVVSTSLTGGKYLRVTPGISTKMTPPGATLTNTRDGTALEDLIGQAIFASGGDKP